MGDEFGPTFITVTDENGDEIELEYVDSLEYDGVTYTAFFPAEVEGDDAPEEELGLIILKTIVENGEEILSTLDSDEELSAVYDLFMEQLLEEDSEE